MNDLLNGNLKVNVTLDQDSINKTLTKAALVLVVVILVWAIARKLSN